MVQILQRLVAATLIGVEAEVPAKGTCSSLSGCGGNASAIEAIRLGWGSTPVPASWGDRVAAMLARAGRITDRVNVSRWIRYRANPGDAAAGARVDARMLTPIDKQVMRAIAAHPDARSEDVRSALRYPSMGLRGFAWLDGAEPLCMQWLFTSDDNARLRRMPVWAGMYPHLPEGVGHVEKLWTFSTARQKGVATRFAQGMFAAARARSLIELRTHIHEKNVAARQWAQRTGWEAYGTITRYAFDFPGLRSGGLTVFVHATGYREA